MKIIEILSEMTLKDKKVAILLRHSERFLIKSNEFGNDVLLTPNGQKMSIEFGRLLKAYKIYKIFSSPIERCRQTADGICKGYNDSVKIVSTNVLGDPGVHIYDPEKLGEYYLEKGFQTIFSEYKKGIPVPGLHSPEIIKIKFDDYLNENTKTNQISLFITHDWQIAFYAFAKKLKEYTEDDWINYLEGLILEF